MAKIYRLSDRIKLKVDDLVVTIGPLSIHQKSSVEGLASSAGVLKASLLAMKYGIEDISGLIDKDGLEYKLPLDENGNLTDEAIDDLFNMESSYKLVAIALNLINNIPNEFIDINTGKKLEGVEFIVENKDSSEKKIQVVSGI